MTQPNHAYVQETPCTQHEQCQVDGDGKHWRLRLSYGRDAEGRMVDLWSDDPWAVTRVELAEINE